VHMWFVSECDTFDSLHCSCSYSLLLCFFVRSCNINLFQHATSSKKKFLASASSTSTSDTKTKSGKSCSVCADNIDISLPIDSVTKFPVKVAKNPHRLENVSVCIVERSVVDATSGSVSGTEYLLVQRPDFGLLAGLWEAPSVVFDEEVDKKIMDKKIDAYLKGKLGMRNFDLVERVRVGEVLHVFSHIKQTLYVEFMKVSGNITFEKLENFDQEDVSSEEEKLGKRKRKERKDKKDKGVKRKKGNGSEDENKDMAASSEDDEDYEKLKKLTKKNSKKGKEVKKGGEKKNSKKKWAKKQNKKFEK